VGSVARFINHSCDGGNLQPVLVRASGSLLPRLCFFAARDIVEGEELTFSYGDARLRPKGLPCFCGSLGCSGVLRSQETWVDSFICNDIQLVRLCCCLHKNTVFGFRRSHRSHSFCSCCSVRKKEANVWNLGVELKIFLMYFVLAVEHAFPASVHWSSNPLTKDVLEEPQQNNQSSA
jgi:hypothetical protein